MDLRIALTGDFYAGKTTLARTLEQRGWTVLDHTGLLKELGHRALKSVGMDISISELSTDKDHYRRFLEEMGICIGWDEGFGITQCLSHWNQLNCPIPVVVDTIRTLNQWRLLENEGFTLVRMSTPLEIREQRAATMGVSKQRLLDIQSHLNQSLLPPQEHEILLSNYRTEVTADGARTFEPILPEILANILESRLSQLLTAELELP